MTRQKKSRKPKATIISTPKDALFSSKDKKPKKKTGLKSGNKQQVAVKKQKQPTSKTAKDPRIGSKTPIVLIKETPKQAPTTSKPLNNQDAIAAIKKAPEPLSLAEQLAAIENDERLWSITEQQENGQELSQTDVDYYNQQMDEYQRISEQLGADEDSNNDQVSAQDNDDDSLSEEELWQKFNSDDYDFSETE